MIIHDLFTAYKRGIFLRFYLTLPLTLVFVIYIQDFYINKSKSTASAGLIVQSILSRALDSGNFALMASIDLSVAFDLVNIDLLMKPFSTIDLPNKNSTVGTNLNVSLIVFYYHIIMCL